MRGIWLLLLLGLLAACAAPRAPEPPPPIAATPAAPTVPEVAPPSGPTLAQLAFAALSYRASVLDSLETPLDAIAGDAPILGRWHRILTWSQTNGENWRACALDVLPCRGAEAREWRALIAPVRALSAEARLDQVNRGVNLVPYAEDFLRWSEADYWATPEEFLLGVGDCEDFAIAKYLALRHLGVPAELLRIVVVSDTIRGQDHAVLAVGPPGEAVILDSLSSEIFPDTLYRHYVPVMSVNELGRWQHVPRDAAPVHLAGPIG